MSDSNLITRLRLMVDDVAHTDRETATSDGTSLVYRMKRRPIVASSLTVKDNGVTYASSGYTVDTADGLVTFTSSPTSGNTEAFTYDYAMFSDDEIQQVIDGHVIELHGVALSPAVSGVYDTWPTIFYSPYKPIATGYIIEDSSGSSYPATGTGTSLDEGKFAMATGFTVALYLTGRTVDLNACAADLWEFKAAKCASYFSAQIDGQRIDKSALSKQALEMARSYRARSRGLNSVVT